MSQASSQAVDVFSLVADLLTVLESEGIQFSEKAAQALNYAAADARKQNYKHIYDDSILSGLVQAQTSVALFLAQNGIDAHRTIAAAREPVRLPYDFYHYRLTHSRKRSENRQRRFINRSFGAVPNDLPLSPLRDLPAEVQSEDLFLAALNMPAVWQAFRDSGISANKVRREINAIRTLDPAVESQRLLMTFDGRRFGVQAFDLLDIARLESLAGEPRPLFRVNLLTPQEDALLQQIEEFEWLINQEDAAEFSFQRFFEQHPSFLLGIEHKAIHSQLILTRADASDLRPDFFMERVDLPLADIAELKLPASRLAVGKANRIRFSASATEVMAQLREYHSYFNDRENRESFNKRYGIDAYKPRLYAIIGRSDGFTSPSARRDLEAEHPNIRLLTYDDLVSRAKRSLELLRSFS
jgi:hypothetical protein